MAKDTKNKTKVEKKDKKEKKTFFRDFKAELKKVTWPTAKQLVSKTAIVIAMVLIISGIVALLDFAFEKGYEFTTRKAIDALQKQTVTEQTTDGENSEQEVEINAENATENTETSENKTEDESNTEKENTTEKTDEKDKADKDKNDKK